MNVTRKRTFKVSFLSETRLNTPIDLDQLQFPTKMKNATKKKNLTYLQSFAEELTDGYDCEIISSHWIAIATKFGFLRPQNYLAKGTKTTI